ncbi:MAG: hypothetical protein WC444_06005 [Candidatus Paceibacterota bacterium]
MEAINPYDSFEARSRSRIKAIQMELDDIRICKKDIKKIRDKLDVSIYTKAKILDPFEEELNTKEKRYSTELKEIKHKLDTHTFDTKFFSEYAGDIIQFPRRSNKIYEVCEAMNIPVSMPQPLVFKRTANTKYGHDESGYPVYMYEYVFVE